MMVVAAVTVLRNALFVGRNLWPLRVWDNGPKLCCSGGCTAMKFQYGYPRPTVIVRTALIFQAIASHQS